MICSSVNLPRFIVQSLQQGRTLILRGGKTQWQVSRTVRFNGRSQRLYQIEY
jgi:hypothetical protein